MSDKRYRLTFTPIEPYFFGEEKRFGFDNLNNEEKYPVDKNNYFIKSALLPSQSTIIGTIRFIVLRNNSDSKPDENGYYTNPDRELVGKNSFTMDGSNDFGKIKRIDPVHLINGETEYYRIPYVAKKPEKKNKYEFDPMMLEEAGCFNGHDYILPKVKEFDPKVGLASGWMDLEGNCIEDSAIFGSVEKTRIQKQPQNNKKGFFKKEYRYFIKDEKLKGEWGFCCYIIVDDSVDAFENEGKIIVQMGQDKSSFAVSAVEDKEDRMSDCPNSFISKISDKMKGCLPDNYTMKYAASDLYFEKDYFDYVSYAIVTQKCFRFMTTVDSEKDNFYKRLKKSGLYYLVNAGSVFFVKDAERLNELKACNNIDNWGFNALW